MGGFAASDQRRSEGLRSQNEQDFKVEGRIHKLASAGGRYEKRRKSAHWPGKMMQIKRALRVAWRLK